MLRRRHTLLSAVWCYGHLWRLWMCQGRHGTPFYISVTLYPDAKMDYGYVARCQRMAERIARGRTPRRYDGRIVT